MGLFNKEFVNGYVLFTSGTFKLIYDHDWALSFMNGLQEMSFLNQIKHQLVGYLGYLLPLTYIVEKKNWGYLIVPCIIGINYLGIDFSSGKDFLNSFYNSLIVGSYFGLGNFIAFEIILYQFILRIKQRQSVWLWELWIIAFIGFTFGYGIAFIGNKWGYYIWESDITLLYVLDQYVRTIPIWFLICLLALSLLVKMYLDQELEKIGILNQGLIQSFNSKSSDFEKQIETLSSVDSTSELSIRGTMIQIRDISHITVEEHYCRLFVKQNSNVLQEFSVKSPLKGLLSQLPDDRFIHIHRSHVVNLEFIIGIEKNHRTYQVILSDRQNILPLSRHRIIEVFPKIETYLKIKRKKNSLSQETS